MYKQLRDDYIETYKNDASKISEMLDAGPYSCNSHTGVCSDNSLRSSIQYWYTLAVVNRTVNSYHDLGLKANLEPYKKSISITLVLTTNYMKCMFLTFISHALSDPEKETKDHVRVALA